MRQIKNVLREAGCLDDRPHLDCAIILDEPADRKQEVGRELPLSISKFDRGKQAAKYN